MICNIYFSINNNKQFLMSISLLPHLYITNFLSQFMIASRRKAVITKLADCTIICKDPYKWLFNATKIILWFSCMCVWWFVPLKPSKAPTLHIVVDALRNKQRMIQCGVFCCMQKKEGNCDN